MKCVYFKNDPLKIILYMEKYSLNIEKEILIHVINMIIRNIDLNSVTNVTIEIIEKISVLCINSKIKPYEFLTFLEKFYIKEVSHFSNKTKKEVILIENKN